MLGLFAATVGLSGNVAVAFYNNHASMQLERFRSQSSLVLEAIKTGNPDSACRNLEFLADLNRVDNPEETKRQCNKHHPYLPPASTTSSPKGSCRVPNPQTRGNECILVDGATCSKLGGEWVGGQCGPG